MTLQSVIITFVRIIIIHIFGRFRIDVNTSCLSILQCYWNKQPTCCDAEKAGTQILKWKCLGIVRCNVWGNYPGESPGKTFGGECLDPHAGLKYLHAAFMICATLVNTHTGSFWPATPYARPTELNKTNLILVVVVMNDDDFLHFL